jgi:hypothetical protein
MIFLHTTRKSSKWNSSYNIIVNSNQTHLEVHGYVHSKIVKQLLELDFVPSQRSLKIEQSR